MNFHARKQELLERATHVEKEASRVKPAQAQDVMRALAALYREMAEELEESGLFERRFPPLEFADLAGDVASFQLRSRLIQSVHLVELDIDESSAQEQASYSCAGR